MKFVAFGGVAPVAAAALSLLLAPAPAPAQANPCNPCAGRTNPCAGKSNPCNPCAGKSNPCNPCGGKSNPCNPCGGKANPCSGKANPCAGRTLDPGRFVQPKNAKLATGRHSELVIRGRELWNDPNLGKSGLACASCHTDDYGMMNDTFDQPYPHYVAMPAHQAGVEQVNAAEMVNFCMLVPMADEPLEWSSAELAALAAYVESIQPGFQPGRPAAAANPCNPCAGRRNPCAP